MVALVPIASAATTAGEAVTMVEQTPEEIERLLEAGAWLKAGQLAALFGVDESTIHRWFKQGRLPYRRVGGDGQREADPEAVKLRLRAARHVHGA